MKRFFKNHSTVPYIKTVKVERRDPRVNVFSYPPNRDRNWVPREYGTCDPELDAMSLPFSDKSDLTEEKGKTLRKVYNQKKCKH